MAQPLLIIEYTNLLHKYRDPGAAPVKAFLEKHAADKLFQQRAQALNRVFQLKAQLVTSGRQRS